MTIRRARLASTKATFVRHLAALCIVALAAGPLPADEPTRFVKELHGIQPGRSTLDDLQAHPRWGTPARVRHVDALTMELSYAMPPWRDARVITRGDVVRAIDLLPPGRYEPVELVEPFELGALKETSALPPGADLPVGTTDKVGYMDADRAYVVLLTREDGGKRVVERIRLYMPGSGPDLVLPGEAPAAMAELTGPTDTMRLAVKTAASVFPARHISRHPLDDEIGRRAWQWFLESLDPGKLLLTRSDLERWESHVLQVDDTLLSGELALFWEAAGIARQRAARTIGLVAELLREPVDFRRDEVFRRDQARAAFALTDADLRERWRQSLKFQLLFHRAAGADEYEARLRVWRAAQADLGQLLELDDDGVLERVIQGLARAYDPYSSYLTAKAQERAVDHLRGNLVGIGAQLGNQLGYHTVEFTLEGSPAEQAGLQPGDRLLAVAQGDQGLWRSVVGMPTGPVIQRIRGTGGTVVRLKVLAPDATTTRTVRLIRAPIQQASTQGTVLAAPILGEGRREKIGYINLPRFYRATAMGGDPSNPASSSRDVRELLNHFVGQRVDAVVLDVRANVGGVLGEVDALAEMFNGSGPVRQWRTAEGKTGVQTVAGAAVWTGPLVVVTDADAGSGGEILVAALADRNRALVVGAAQTLGNGSIRNLYRLEQFLRAEPPPALGSIWITELLVYRITGDAVQQAGVRSHIVLPQPHTLASLDRQHARDLPSALRFDRVPPVADAQPLQYAVSPDLRRWLQQRSNERLAADPLSLRPPESQSVSDLASVVPLHEDDFRGWYDHFYRRTATEIVPGTRNVRLDRELREVLSLTLDYVERLKGDAGG